MLENKKAQLVVITGDVYSSKLMIFLPALSHKMEGVIINGKARLAQRKLCTTIAFKTVNSEDKWPKTKVVETIRASEKGRLDLWPPWEPISWLQNLWLTCQTGKSKVKELSTKIG